MYISQLKESSEQYLYIIRPFHCSRSSSGRNTTETTDGLPATSFITNVLLVLPATHRAITDCKWTGSSYCTHILRRHITHITAQEATATGSISIPARNDSSLIRSMGSLSNHYGRQLPAVSPH